MKGGDSMLKTTLAIDGMACSMCESHVNDAIRKEFPVKKVTSDHKKGETVILSETALDPAQLTQAVGKTGYTVTAVSSEPYQKKGFFGFGK